jgi:prepilin-type N-terminal cleavage/methylation domain-containing protein
LNHHPKKPISMKTHDIHPSPAEPRSVSSPRPAPGSGRLTGFTLTELLVVIAIIVVLAAALIPMVANMRANAQASLAIQRIRQCGTIVMQKAVDNNNIIVIHVNGTSSNMRDLRLYGMIEEIVGEEEVGRYVYTPAYEKLASGTWPVWATNTDDDPENGIVWGKAWFERGGEQRYAESLNLARCSSLSGYPLLADSSNADGVPRARFANDDDHKFALRYKGRGPVYLLDGSARMVVRGEMHLLGIKRAYLFKKDPASNPTLVSGRRR